MAYGYGGVGERLLLDQDVGDGLAHDVGPADHHHVLAFRRQVVGLEQYLHAPGGAGLETRAAEHEVAQADGMEPVHVLGGRDEVQELVGGKMRGQGQLQQDAVHGGIVVLPDQVIGKLPFGDGGGEAMGPGLDAHILGGRVLGADVDGGGGIFARPG